MARALEVDLDGFGAMSLTAANPARISSLCTVFAESEVISLISKGARRADIIAGIHDSVASRVAAMANRVGVTAPVMMTGGVAHNIGVVKALEAKLGQSLNEINGKLASLEKSAQPAAKATAAPPAKKKAQAAPAKIHVVKAGETLYQISRQYGLTVDQLKKINKMGTDVTIRPGQELTVSAP
jgi:LysM repeat protein